MAAPSTFKAYAAIATGDLDHCEVKEFDMPVPKADEVLIKVRATALNPVDWKVVQYNILLTGLPYITGCDLAGDVVAVGADVTNVKVGDAVSAYPDICVHENGSHGEYCTAPASLIIPKPADMSYESASTLSMTSLTAALGLTKLGYLKKAEAGSGPFLLVWGASSSVGQFVVSLGTRAGLKVIGVCSEHNFDLVKSLGAVAVFSYKKDSVLDDIKGALGGEQLTLVYDCIGTGAGDKCAALMAGDKPAKLTYIADAPTEETVPANVEVSHTFIVYCYTDKALNEVCKGTLPEIIGALSEGVLKPNKVELLEGGLAGITAGFKRLQEGKVSGVKLVVSLAGDAK